MRCVVDKYIPFIQGRLEHLFDTVTYLDPKQINHSAVCDADVLLIRTRTLCTEALLGNTKVKFIGTATIGTDHIDLAYCRQQGITVCNAPGCNARGVAQYVESALDRLGIKSNQTIGIVGVGHVGRLVEDMAKRLGLKTMLYDPPRQRIEGGDKWIANISDIAKEADIITFHTPLTKSGPDKTYHLADNDFLTLCKQDAIIINAARGGIIDEEALIRYADRFRIVIDTWENEPNINTTLLNQTTIGTPHIAGYSDEGKRNAARMILERLAEYMQISVDTSDLQTDHQPLPVYDIMQDDKMLRKAPQHFELLRQQYTFRQ